MLQHWPDYELMDFGEGRKLERFGPRMIGRPCPAAQNRPTRLSSWNVHAEFLLADDRRENQRGHWKLNVALEPTWDIDIGPVTMRLKMTSFGHIGLFPEHFQQWQWALADVESLHGARFLNLFAYTGAFTLLLATVGSHVTHVDSSGAAVRWARMNAELSGLSAAPIRWIIEDAKRFVEREVKRGARYDGFLVDAPTFGRGPRNETWEIERDLQPLIANLRELVSENPRLIVVSSHTLGFDSRRLRQLQSGWGESIVGAWEADELLQPAGFGRTLANGTYARWKRS